MTGPQICVPKESVQFIFASKFSIKNISYPPKKCKQD